MGFLTSSVQIKKDKPVFIDFWATWCGPCRVISPFFEKLAGEVEGAEFYKVDVDDQPDSARDQGLQSQLFWRPLPQPHYWPSLRNGFNAQRNYRVLNGNALLTTAISRTAVLPR